MGRGCGARRESGPRRRADRDTQRGREDRAGRDEGQHGRARPRGAAPAAAHLPRPGSSRRGRLGSLPARSCDRCPRPPGSPAPSLLPSPLLQSSRRPGRLRGSGPAGTFSASERPPARPPAARPRGGSEGCALRAGPGRAASPPARAPDCCPGRRSREPPQAARARDQTSLRLRQCASSGARAARPRPRPVPLCPSLSLPGSDLRGPRGLEGTGSAAGAAQRPGPCSTLRKLVFLRSARRAGYIVFLRWTGEVAADLPSPPDSGRARLVPAARWREAGGGEGVGE
ncbi:uncharacterized protein LOC128931969 [Callithrix jacchus]